MQLRSYRPDDCKQLAELSEHIKCIISGTHDLRWQRMKTTAAGVSLAGDAWTKKKDKPVGLSFH